MGEDKDKPRLRKIKKIGKKLGIALIFLIASYFLSLLSFYLYTQLSRFLHPEEKGFLGFAIIGLSAGFITVLVSLVNKRLILTVVISFFIDCLVNSILLYPKLGMEVIQFLPGLLVGMFAVIISCRFLKIKLGLSTDDNKERIGSKYVLARRLIENPDKITLEVFKEVCGLLKDIDPKIDAILKKAEYVSETLTFIKEGDAIGFALYNMKVKTEEDKEKKEKLLLFIELINDIRDEVNVAFVRLKAGNPENYVDHPIKQLGYNIVASSGPSGFATVSMAIVVATSVVAANAAGIGSLVPKNELQILKTQNSQEINTMGVSDIVAPSVIPTAIPTNMPTIVPTIAVKAITVDTGWGHFTRIFSGPPDTNPTSVIDYTTIAMYVTVHNNATTEDRIIGGESSACSNITFDDMSIYGPDGTIPNIVIPAKSTVIMDFMKEGRIMCNGVKGIKSGDRFTVGLIFDKFGKVPVIIEIRTGPA